MAMEHREAAEESAAGTGSPEMSIWVWGLIAVGVVALRIGIVSRGNPETALALLQNLNVSATVLATLQPFLAIAVVVMACYAVMNYVKHQNAAPDPKWAGPSGRYLQRYLLATIIVVVFAAALAYYSMSRRAFLGLLGLIGLVTALSLLRRCKRPVVFWLASGLYFVVILGVLTVGSWKFVSQDRLWLPKERIVTGGWWDTGIVYVLSSDEVWTKYLDEETRTVRAIPTSDVKARYPVSGG